MPSIKDLKKRISTVKNTQQTTRAMKMVSAAKLRRAQDAIQNHRPYAKHVLELIHELCSVSSSEENPLIRKKASLYEGEAQKRVLLVLVTSDRGLCGGFNSNVIKATQRWLNNNSQLNVEISFVGKKGYDFFKGRKVKLSTYFQELSGKVTFQKSKKLADAILNRYLAGEIDEVKFVYNEFQNAVTQRVMIEDFLPLFPGTSEEGNEGEKAQEKPLRDYIIKPNAKEVLKELLQKNFAIQAFRILLESQAGEHGARMSAMENATKNAGEMIRKLTLLYNKQRQASITKELLEIISGSESQKG